MKFLLLLLPSLVSALGAYVVRPYRAPVGRLTALLSLLPLGAALNLERAMRADDRLGGHLVSGHVDGVGRVLAIEPDARAQRWRFTAPPALLRYIARKGSICVDGTSLTVNAVDDAGFEVASFEVTLIPHTVAHTAFAAARVGDAVNLEVDLVARYVERLLSPGMLSARSSDA